MKKDFNDFRFKGLEYRKASNKYYTMNRINEEENKIVIKVDDVHLLPTRFGYAFILDRTHVVFLKEWQVNRNFYGNEVLLDKNYFQAKEWGEHENFPEYDCELSFEYYKNIAQEQQKSENVVRWLR
jgi:hypothetical protein